MKVRVDEKYIYVQVGPRDWQWEKDSGRLIAVGTELEGAGTGACGGKAFEEN